MRIRSIPALAAVFMATASPVHSQAVGPAPIKDALPISDGVVIASDQQRFTLRTITDGLKFPWNMVFLPDGDMLVTERRGTIRRIHQGRLMEQPVAGGPADVLLAGAQAGLHGIALHPQFARNGLVYLEYDVGPEEASRARLARYRYHDGVLSDGKVLFESDVRNAKRSHSGGKLMFLPDGSLLMSTGTSFLPGLDQAAQNPGSTLGKVLRLDADGHAAKGNPFAGRKGARPEIFTWGNRNAQGLTVRPGTSALWEVEHGPQGGDELNILRKGGNYGWPRVTYGIDYDNSPVSNAQHLPGFVQPVWFWRPSIAPGALLFYDGDRYPDWRGDLFVGSLKFMHLERFEMDGDHIIGREVMLDGLGGRVRDLRIGPDGLIYLLTASDPGKVIVLEPAPPVVKMP